MTRQVGNEIDEFVTEALRNNLVGLPLDLATINMARGRDTGVPSLNEARREFFAMTGDSQLTPYTSWVDFAAAPQARSIGRQLHRGLRHPRVDHAADHARRQARGGRARPRDSDGDGAVRPTGSTS